MKDMKICNTCEENYLPLGRATITMQDGGIIEVIMFSCPTCRVMRIEHPKFYSFNEPELHP